MASEILAAWLITVALHASVLLGIAWQLDRGALRARPAWRELMWRAAFFGGIVTASAQVLLDVPASPRVALRTSTVAAAASGNATSLNATVHDERSTAATRTESRVVVAAAPAVSSQREKSPVADATTMTSTLAARLPSWHLMLIAGWLAGALLALARLCAAWLRLERSLAAAVPVTSTMLDTDAAALAIQAGIDAPRLAALEELASPLAARGRRILLPRWAVDLLDREQLRAMLAHETAHIARRDPAWKFAIAAHCALFWFLPLAPLARRRLDEIAELACDAWAARHLGDGRSLAECLAECAERRVGGFDVELAPAMASRESPLLQRIDQLIAGVPMNTQNAGVGAGVVVVAVLALAALVLPGVSLSSASAQPVPPTPPTAPAAPAAPAAPSAASAKSEHHVHVSADVSFGGSKHEFTVVEINDNVHSYRAKINGKITFSDSEDDIASLSDGGSASFSETRLGRTQRIELTSRAASSSGVISSTIRRRRSIRPRRSGSRRWSRP